MGERFYFNKSLSLKTDLRLMIHQAPIPFQRCSGTVGMGTGTCPSSGQQITSGPSFDSFKERITYTTNLEVGLNYLF